LYASVTPLLEHWHEFYVLLGTAAAALVALLFVAATVGVGILTHNTTGPTRTYMSPVAFHFTSVLFIATLALVPSHTRASMGLLIGLDAVAGIVYGTFVLRRLLSDGISDRADRLCYGAAPLVAYLSSLVAAFLFLRGSQWAPEVLAGSALVLLIVNVRNAWDLMLAMSRQRGTQ